MNYKDAYCHMICRLDPIIEALSQPKPVYTYMDVADKLRRLRVECEEIRIGQGLCPARRAPRSGSSLTSK